MVAARARSRRVGMASVEVVMSPSVTQLYSSEYP